MYYSKKIAAKAGYGIVEITYEFSSIAASIKGDAEKTQNALEEGFEQVTNQPKDIQFDQYDRVIFVGKSIGTAIMARIMSTVKKIFVLE